MSGCEGYDAVARVYDLLNKEIDYEAWADFFQQCFDEFLERRPELVLDLACGTGRMSRTLAARGYDMIGVDGSADMLTEAYAAGGEGILYLLQDMRELELYGTVGAAVCCLDSLNYLLCREDLKRVLSLVHNYLDPDGLFLFDVNTPYKFREIYGDRAYVLEDEILSEGEEPSAVFCGWQNEYHPETGICDFYLSVFCEEADGGYSRADEHQQERCYDRPTLETLLRECGFDLLGVWGDTDRGEPQEQTERWYFAARAKK